MTGKIQKIIIVQSEQTGKRIKEKPNSMKTLTRSRDETEGDDAKGDKCVGNTVRVICRG